MNRYTQQKMKFIYTYHVYRTQHHTFTPITSIIIPQGHNYIAFFEDNIKNNNIGKYLLTRQNIKKRKKLLILVKGHYFKIGLIPKAISIHKIPFGQMKFIDKSILCQTFINYKVAKY
jgi:hypothetical protein